MRAVIVLELRDPYEGSNPTTLEIKPDRQAVAEGYARRIAERIQNEFRYTDSEDDGYPLTSSVTVEIHPDPIARVVR